MKHYQIKFWLLLVLLLINISFSRAANIPVYIDSDIYDFLQRMKNRGLITSYSGMQLPLNRDEVANYLEEMQYSYTKLNPIEQKLYIKFRSQYYLELDHQKERQDKTKIKFINTGTPGATMGDMFSRDPALREQHLLSYEDQNEFLWADLDFRAQNQTKDNLQRQILFNQMLLRGGFKKRVAAYLQFDQYLKLNSAQYDELLSEEKGRFINEEVYFSNAYCGLSYTDDLFELGFYQQPFLWGASRKNNLTFSNNGPPFPYFNFSTQIGWLKYSLIHGSLVNDSTSSEFENVNPDRRDMAKNIAAQRFEISLFNGHTYLGFNEMVIYCNRSLEWSYLIPFNFYFAAEHYLEDRDNTLISFDIKSKIVKNTEAYLTFFLDELKWSELGGQWWANKHAVQAGIRNHTYLLGYPVNLQFEYTAVRPWTYTHKVFNNNYTNDRYGLGFPYGPNSQLFYLNIDSYLTYRMKLFLEYEYLRHGQDTEENIYGGNATANYEERNPKYDNSTEWLMGDIYSREEIQLGMQYEFFNDCFFRGALHYRIANNNTEKNYLITDLGVSVNF
ncbi:MAG: capsule assembly Wzi family protein [Candidatus Marinimicrobia bacterium]|nr:capsule assembly Wzi family protein [Candidatus Neomarinimicrobiota bacterium]